MPDAATIPAIGRLGWAALGLATAARFWHAWSSTRRRTGSGPGVTTDDGVHLHVEVAGRPDAEVTVLLVHGFAARIEALDEQRVALGEHARVVSFDQRGHGRSGWGGFRGADLPRLGGDLETVLDRCAGPGPVVLVGHSMGAMAVLALTAARPELVGSRVVGVALLSASTDVAVPGLSRPHAAWLAHTRLLRAAGWGLWALAPIADRMQVLRTSPGRRALRHFLFGSAPPTAEVLSRVQRMWVETPRDIAAALYPRLLAHDTNDGPPALAGVPSLVLCGAEDRTIDPAHSTRIAEAIGERARLVRVAGAGHMVTVTHAAEVNEELLDLLADVRAGCPVR